MQHVIICGAPKCATTSLFRYLAHCPEVRPSFKKELNYFLDDSGKKPYESFFQSRTAARYTLEASPAYTREAAVVAPKVAARLPTARLIFILRDPVTRLSSYFNMESVHFQRIKATVDFDDYVQVILGEKDTTIISDDSAVARFIVDGAKVGKYSDLLTLYARFMARENIYVMFQEELKHDPGQAMHGVCAFLGLDSSVYEGYRFETENKSVRPRSAALYRLAVKINGTMEPLLNKAPVVRRLIRKIHNAVNTRDSAPQPLSAAAVAGLQRYYLQSNLELHELLQSWPNRGNIPAWLDRLQAPTQ